MFTVSNWETLGKHAGAMNISGKIFVLCFVDVELKLTDQSSVPGSRVTLPKTFSLYRRAIFNPLER